ncbi:MAG: hypothetical protein GF313_06870 [Caldithrix sp.]|nr:hypothetical protein [Caldithrix sp.]
MKKSIIVITVFLFFSVAVASTVFTEVSAEPGTDRVTIAWTTKSETNIKHFSVHRSNDDKNYIQLDKINPQGPGTRYNYIDENVMFEDTSVLFYKVKAIDINGQVLDESSMLVHPNISGMFRTWGAIKAMFR